VSAADATPPVRVRRGDDRLGLVALRISLPPSCLVTTVRDHAVVRTPERPDYHDGNVLDLAAPPEVGDVDRWVARAIDQASAVRSPHVRIRWEEPLDADAPAGAPDPSGFITVAFAAHGFVIDALTVLRLDDAAMPDAPDGPGSSLALPGVTVHPALAADGDAAVDRQWHAVGVLHRYDAGDSPAEWRGWDEQGAAWWLAVMREHVRRGRARVWLASAQGMPIATVALVDDRRGASVVEDLVVHPVHRGRGVAAGLERHALVAEASLTAARHLLVAVVPGSTSDRLQRRLGFVPHATVWVAHRPPGAVGAA
jgi:GNAT superfamily N-acetyltransferase